MKIFVETQVVRVRTMEQSTKLLKVDLSLFEPVSKDTMGSLKIFETRWHYTKNKKIMFTIHN